MRFLETNERDNNILNVTLDVDLGNAELLSSTSYNTFDQEGTRDQTDLLLLYGYGDFPAFSAYTEDSTDDKILTQEVRLVSTDDNSRVDYILGLFYQDGDLQQGSNEFAPNFNLFGPPLPNNQVTFIDVTNDLKELAVFGELGFDVTERLHLLAGARWFDVDTTLVNCIQFTLFDPTPTCETGDASGDDVIYKLGADFQVNDTALLYALFSQGISLGGVNPGALIPPEYRFIKPETGDNYEIGIRSTLGNGALMLNAAAFWINITDVQVDDFVGVPVVSNAGKARTYGLEIDLLAKIGERWELSAGITLTDSKITTAGPDYNARLPGSPEETLNFGITYGAPVANGLDLEAIYRVAVQGDVTTRLSGGETLGGFAVHHASVGLGNDTWQATLFADNLFDKYAVTGVRDDRGMIGADGSANNFALRRYFQYVLTPRTLGVDVRYRFK
jgi:outer membrane receptor protein involved in Fe transport